MKKNLLITIAILFITLHHLAQADVCQGASEPKVCVHVSEDGKSIRYTKGSQVCECSVTHNTKQCTCTGPVQASGKDYVTSIDNGYKKASDEFQKLKDEFYK